MDNGGLAPGLFVSYEGELLNELASDQADLRNVQKELNDYTETTQCPNQDIINQLNASENDLQQSIDELSVESGEVVFEIEIKRGFGIGPPPS